MDSTIALQNSHSTDITFSLPNILIEPVNSTQQPATIKMEDLETNHSVTDDVDIIDHMDSLASSTSPSADNKQVKKRKSWGQVLPEPKTNLPPRKRAKTADEKEQRRIERVKRNRLAAHNSRERKRQEVEELQVHLDQINAQLKSTQELASQQAKELQYYRSMFPDAAANGNFASLKVNMGTTLPNPLQAFVAANAAPYHPSQSTVSASSATTSPNMAASLLETPDSLRHNLDSPATSPEPATPLNFENNSLFNTEPLELDQTQHSAVMLCPGLQCQSTSAVPCSLSKPIQPLSAPLMQRHRRYPAATLATTALIILNLSLSTLNSLSRAHLLRQRSRKSQTTATSRRTSSLPSLNQLLSHLFSLSTRSLPSSTTSLHPLNYLLLSFRQATMSTAWTRLMASLPTCTPAQAQQLLLATSQALLRNKNFSRSECSSSSRVRFEMTDSQADHSRGRKPKKIGTSGDIGYNSSLGGGWEDRFRTLLAHKQRARRMRKTQSRLRA